MVVAFLAFAFLVRAFLVVAFLVLVGAFFTGAFLACAFLTCVFFVAFFTACFVAAGFFTSAFFLAFAIHTWRGTWAVATDYLTPRFFGDFGKYAYLAFRLFVASIIAFVLTWSFFIIW